MIIIILTYYLFTESEVITGNYRTEALMHWSSDSEVSTLRFPPALTTERTRLISYLLNGLFIKDLTLRLNKTNNWLGDNLKNMSPQWAVRMSPRYT